MDESGADEAKVSKKVASGRRVAVVIRSLVNLKSLQLECVRVLHESFLVFVIMYDLETMIWKEKHRSRIRAVQMANLRDLLAIRRMDKVPNAQIRQLCHRVMKGVDEKMNVFSNGSAMWRGGRMTGLLLSE